MSPLSHINVYAKDLIAHRAHTGDPLAVVGARTLLWAFACEEDETGTIPNDPDRIARWLMISPDDWDDIQNQVTAGWELNGANRWIIRRLVKQGKRANSKREQAQAAAASRWHPETGHADACPTETCGRNASSSSSSSPSSPPSSPSASSKKNADTAISASGSLLPLTAREGATNPSLDELKEKAKARKKPDPRQNPMVLEVWEYYMGKGWRNPDLYKLTRERARQVEIRMEDLRKKLKASDEDQVVGLKRAIDTMGASAFHQGENDQGEAHNTLENVIRSWRQLEWWLNRGGNGAHQGS